MSERPVEQEREPDEFDVAEDERPTPETPGPAASVEDVVPEDLDEESVIDEE